MNKVVEPLRASRPCYSTVTARSIQLSKDTHQSYDVLKSLLTLAHSHKPLPCACLRSIQSHLVKKHDVDGPTLAFPLLGCFRYSENGTWNEVHPGSILVVPNARSFDIEYIPAVREGEFIALSVVLTENQLQAARLLLAEPPESELGAVSLIEIERIIEPLRRWTRAMDNGERALSLHAMVEVVIHLHGYGHRGLLRPAPSSLAATIKRMITSEPGKDWSAEEVESLMGVSGSTLRRKLATEHTTLRNVIADARVAAALHLLMSSNLPLKTIASKVGYASVASFSRRFTDRYGTEPSKFR